MNDERRLSDADVDRIANAVAARLRDEAGNPKSTRAAGTGGTADARNGGNRRLPPSQRRRESAQRDHSRNDRGGDYSRNEQVEPTGGRVRDDVAASRQRKDDARGIERLDEPRAVPDRNTSGTRSAEDDGAGVTFESTLDDEGRVVIPAEIVAELDVEPGSSVRLTVHRTK